MEIKEGDLVRFKEVIDPSDSFAVMVVLELRGEGNGEPPRGYPRGI
jgi:hypothetical protein